MVFPLNDSVIRQPLCSGGSLGLVPRPPSSYGLLRIPDAHPASLVLAPRYRPVSVLFAPAGGRHPSRGPGFVLRGLPHHLRCRRKHLGLPSSWGTPMPACPALRPRWKGRAKPFGPPDVAFRSFKGVGSTVGNFRGSITRPARLPVYASQPRSPWVHARLGSGCWLGLAGRMVRWVPIRGFRLSKSSFPLDQALLGAMNAYKITYFALTDMDKS